MTKEVATMRQLRLKGEDIRYRFLYQGDIPEEVVESMKEYLRIQAEEIRKHSFAEEPLFWEEGQKCYQIGYVPCDRECVVKLPDTGSVFAAGSKGGFFIAAECENRKVR